MILATMSKFAPISPSPYVFGGTVNVGRFVKVDQDDGKVTEAADQATIVLGVAVDDGADTEVRRVVEAYPGVRFRMTYTGTFAQSMMGKYFGLDVTVAGDHRVNLDDTSNDIFKLFGHGTTPDGVAYVDVEVKYAASQALIEVS